jgi:hypothetical protein
VKTASVSGIQGFEPGESNTREDLIYDGFDVFTFANLNPDWGKRVTFDA